MLHIIIILPSCCINVIWRININALHLPGVLALQCLQRQEVVPVDQHIFSVRVGGGVGQCGVFNQQAGLHQNGFILAVLGQFQLIGHCGVPPVLFVPKM